MILQIALKFNFNQILDWFRGGIVVSILACHARDPGSIPGLGKIL